MSTTQATIACTVILALPAVFARAADTTDKQFTYVDIQPKANQPLTEGFHRGGSTLDNDLSELPMGEQTFEGVDFEIGKACIQLSSSVLRKNKEGKVFPSQVEGIQVGRSLTKLHVLHGTAYSTEYGTSIAKYTVRYEDQSKSPEVFAIVYGEDVRDWWNTDESRPVKRAKLAWQGVNNVVQQRGLSLRLYLTTWTNPRPDEKILSIDFESSNEAPPAKPEVSNVNRSKR